MGKFVLIGLVAALAIVAGWWYSSQSMVPVISESSETLTDPVSEPIVNTAGTFNIISPNGGETFKLGDTIRVSWDAQNIPSIAEFELMLFEITGTSPVFNAEGMCTNCVEKGLLVTTMLESVANGLGSTEWVAGKEYSRSYVDPGSRYILRATLSQSTNAGACSLALIKDQCAVYHRDWSDGTFALTLSPSATSVSETGVSKTGWITTSNAQLGIRFEHPADASISPVVQRQTDDGTLIGELVVTPKGMDPTTVHFFTTNASVSEAKNIQMYGYHASHSDFTSASIDGRVGLRRLDQQQNRCTEELSVVENDEIVYGYSVVSCPTHSEGYDQLRRDIASSLTFL